MRRTMHYKERQDVSRKRKRMMMGMQVGRSLVYWCWGDGGVALFYYFPQLMISPRDERYHSLFLSFPILWKMYHT